MMHFIKCIFGQIENILIYVRLYIFFLQQDCESNKTKGLDYMYMAAKAGCRSAMIHLAQAYETGLGLSSDR